MSKTIFCDIDGTILSHLGDGTVQHLVGATVLPNVKKRLNEWSRKGYKLILVTARKPSTKEATEKQLAALGISYDEILMGINGQRVLINDEKPNDDAPTALAVNLKRNKGFVGQEIENV